MNSSYKSCNIDEIIFFYKYLLLELSHDIISIILII